MPEAEEGEILWCQLCEGTGKFKEGTCPACGGIGKFRAPDKWVWCSLCRGSGKVKEKVIREETERGRTWILEDRPCPACGGKGRVRPSEL